MILEENRDFGIKYVVWKPADFDENKKYPVIFFTHGAGSRGDDLDVIKNHVSVKKIVEQVQNAIIVAPQCRYNSWFDVFGELLSLARKIYDMPFTDKTRFYGSGVSMGGYAMFQLMESEPRLFAAGIICCGGGMYWNAERLKNIPLRLFHGAKDEIVYPEESKRMYEKITAFGGNAQLVVFPECDHNCWDKTFGNSENVDWLLKQEKKIK